MKRMLFGLLSVLVLVGCNGTANKEIDGSRLYNEDGSITEYHAEIMQAEWCAHNEGEDFAKEQCADVDY